MKIVYVGCVILMNDAGEVLLNQRQKGQLCALQWEFPGGKVEAGETPAACAVREMQEEVGVHIQEADLEPFCFVTNDFPQVDRHAVALLFLCRTWKGQPHGAEGQEVKWENIKNLPKMLPQMLPNSDLIVQQLQHYAK